LEFCGILEEFLDRVNKILHFYDSPPSEARPGATDQRHSVFLIAGQALAQAWQSLVPRRVRRARRIPAPASPVLRGVVAGLCRLARPGHARAGRAAALRPALLGALRVTRRIAGRTARKFAGRIALRRDSPAALPRGQ